MECKNHTPVTTGPAPTKLGRFAAIVSSYGQFDKVYLNVEDLALLVAVAKEAQALAERTDPMSLMSCTVGMRRALERLE